MLSLYLSEAEAVAVRASGAARRCQCGRAYCFDTFASKRSAPACRDILFVAGFAHPPNEDAARWFVSEVLPLVRSRVGGVRLLIAGSHPSPASWRWRMTRCACCPIWTHEALRQLLSAGSGGGGAVALRCRGEAESR